MAIPESDGRPIISYFDLTNSSLKVMKCGNASCSAGNVATTLDNTGALGRHTSVAVGTTGAPDLFPVISYFGGVSTTSTAAGTLKVAKCLDANCTTAPTLTVVDSSVASVGLFTSIAIPPAGAPNRFPVISYYDGTNGNLKVAKCINAACSGATIITVLDGTLLGIDVGRFTSIAVPGDFLPVISYLNVTGANLKVAKCSAADCSGVPTLTTVDGSGTVAQRNSISISTDGFPVIAYQNQTSSQLRVFKCTNATCSTGSFSIVDSALDPQFISITVPADGKPVISYQDVTAAALKAAKCGDAACSAGNTVSTVDSPGAGGNGTAIAVPVDGLPFIAYADPTLGRLKTLKCSNAGCVNP